MTDQAALEGWWVDGQTLHTLASRVAVLPESAPPRRGMDRTVARRPGDRHRRKVHGPRRQQFAMRIADIDQFGREGRPALLYNLDRLKELWHGDGQVEIVRRLMLPDGRHSTRVAHGELVDQIEPQVRTSGVLATFTVDMLLADPYWYEPSRTKSGASAEFVLWNPGTTRHHNAVVRIHGPASSPTLVNHSTGSSVTFDGQIGSGDWVELDSDRFTAVDQNGDSVAGAVVRDDVWFVEIGRGRNRLELSDGTCDIQFRPAFL